MLLLKLSMLGASGSKEMNVGQFSAIANQLYNLQAAAAELGSGKFELKVRAMVQQQIFYQRDYVSELRELMLQKSIFDRSDNYYCNVFQEEFGLTLDSFYKITSFVLVRLEAQSKGVVRMPISELVHFLCPSVPPRHLLAYIRLVSCEAEDLPSYMNEYRLEDIYVSEYFQETPFKYVPFILNGADMVALNCRFCVTAICNLVPELMKRERPAFKDQFGVDMEKRVGEIIGLLAADELVFESELVVLLKKEGYTGKVVDFLVREGNDITLIESKAIEPSDLLKCSTDPDTVERILTPSYIKAVHQVQSVAAALKRCKRFSNCTFRGLVVTFKDHYFFGGEVLDSIVDGKISAEIMKSHGAMPVPLSRISYIPLQSFTSLIHCLKQAKQNLASFLDAACDGQADPGGARFTLAHVVDEQFKGMPMAWAAGIDGVAADHLEAMQSMLRHNLSHWRGNAQRLIEMHASLLRSLRPEYEALR